MSCAGRIPCLENVCQYWSSGWGALSVSPEQAEVPEPVPRLLPPHLAHTWCFLLHRNTDLYSLVARYSPLVKETEDCRQEERKKWGNHEAGQWGPLFSTICLSISCLQTCYLSPERSASWLLAWVKVVFSKQEVETVFCNVGFQSHWPNSHLSAATEGI